VTGCSHIPQGKILLGPGFSSISPASNIVIRITEVFVLFLTGSSIGLRPDDEAVSVDIYAKLPHLNSILNPVSQ
jgi:hypothetical protein